MWTSPPSVQQLFAERHLGAEDMVALRADDAEEHFGLEVIPVADGAASGAQIAAPRELVGFRVRQQNASELVESSVAISSACTLDFGARFCGINCFSFVALLR